MSRLVLVVDDEPDIRELLQLALEHVAGWQVLTASNGPEALIAAADKLPDAILLDVMMPGMDGPETARRLAEDPRTRSIPVVLLTAKVLSSERTALSDTEARAVIGKPFDPMTLAHQIEDALGWGA